MSGSHDRPYKLTDFPPVRHRRAKPTVHRSKCLGTTQSSSQGSQTLLTRPHDQQRTHLAHQASPSINKPPGRHTTPTLARDGIQRRLNPLRTCSRDLKQGAPLQCTFFYRSCAALNVNPRYIRSPPVSPHLRKDNIQQWKIMTLKNHAMTNKPVQKENKYTES